MGPILQDRVYEEVQVSQPNHQNLQPDDIVISGMSGTYPNCHNVNELFEKLYAKVDVTVNETSRWNYQHPEAPQNIGMAPDLRTFDAQFFKVYRKLALVMDVLSRKLLEHAYQAIYDAGVSLAELQGKKVGVFVGVGISDSEKSAFYVPYKSNTLGIVGSSRSMFANRISYWLDAKGPSISIDAGCSSSMVALETACDYINRGMCDSAVVGGASLCLHPQVSVHYHRLGVLSDDGKTRSFDKNSSGAGRSDAINCFLLQKAKNAKRVYATVVHVKSQSSIEKDVMSSIQFGPVRPKKCLVEFWNDFYREANVSPQKVEYVEAFGSAVPEADLKELDAIGELFCKGTKRPLAVGSVMSNIGYTEAASGTSAITKVLLAYHSGQIAANLYYETPHNQLQAIREDQIQIVVENKPFSQTYVAVNNHSLGGLNCHALLHGYNKKKDLTKYKTNIPRLVNISGRIESNVKKILDSLKSRPMDAEEIGLLHNIHSQDIRGHLARGYTVLDENEEGHTVSLADGCEFYPDIRRPVWFVYSGMGSQWAGMGAQLMRIPIFARAIEKCHKILEPKGVDLIKILVEPDKAIYDNILNSFVGIAAVQIGLTDVLRELNVVPDNIIGHSVGELGCGYADGCFTAEEMILSAYSRGLISVKTPFIKGAMAAVGLGYKDIVNLCPPEIEVACHNSLESSTISGPVHEMRAFVEELSTKGIFAKEVPCSNIAYHSRYIAKAGPGLRHYLSEVIKDPKPRSQKWVSTSVPQDRWDEPEAKYSSAEYHTNNLLSPVLFEETSRLIPDNAVVIEIAPHGLLQAILKRSLGPNCVHIPLTRRGHSDPVTFLLENIGKLYQAGLTPELRVLYPTIEFPVSAGTPMLSHLVEWMHTEKWPIPNYLEAQYEKAGRRTIILSVHDEEYQYISGNVKDGAIMFSEAGALVLVWETLAMMSNTKMHELSVRFSDVYFDSEVIVTDDEVLILDLTIQKASGRFEITHKENTVVRGYIQKLKRKLFNTVVSPLTEEYLTSLEIYKLFHVKGYSYSGSFRGIFKSDVDFTKSQMIWNRNWVTFLDSLLQLNILGRTHNGISKLKYMRSILIDTRSHESVKLVKADGQTCIEAQIYSLQDVTRCGGVSLQGIKFDDISQFPRSTITMKREFIAHKPIGSFGVKTGIYVFLQIVAENCLDRHVDVIELVDDHNEQTFGNLLETVAKELTTFSLDHKYTAIENVVDGSTIKHCDVLMGNNLLSGKKVQQLAHKQFIISIEKSDTTIINLPYIEVSAMETPIGRLVLARLPTPEGAPEHNFFVSIPKDVALELFLERTMHNLLPMQRLILIDDAAPSGELVALIRKWRSEQETNNLNLIIMNNQMEIDCNLHEQLRKNLAVNMYKNGCWGSEYYIPLNDNDMICQQVRLGSTVPGDLEALTWMEISEPISSKNVKVHYAGLIHYDVIKAIGARSDTTESDLYGMDYSGVTAWGERVMGVVARGALATAVEPDEELLWPVPGHWTLEDAATVPQPYAHAYYCLKIKSDIRSGSRVLVHCGAGALGQAIISIALDMGCEVFTTVSSTHKKRFLKSLFPELQDIHIGYSRDSSFKQLVMDGTNGKGCDLVVSCLNGTLMEASMACVTNYGTFINVSMTNPYEIERFGMNYLQRNRTYIYVNFFLIFENEDSQTKKELRRMVSEGIAEGCVRPLTRVTLPGGDVSRAARFLASGNHRGRVLLKPTYQVAQLKLTLSDSVSYAVVCGDHELGLELIDRLIMRGAKKLLIHYNQKNETGYLKAKLGVWKNVDVNIEIVSHNLQIYSNVLDYLHQSAELGHVEGVFLIDENNDIGGESPVEHLDEAVRKLCPLLKYFVVLRPTADRTEPKSKRVCARRALEGLPALYLNMPTLAKFGQRKEVNQSIGSALDALETSLRLRHRDAVTCASRDAPECDLLDKVGDLLGTNLKELPRDTTLRSLGLDFEKAEMIKNLLERRYKYPCSRRNLPDITVGRLSEIAMKSASFTKAKPKKLDVFFRTVDPDELTSSAEMLVMQTLVYEPQIRSDQFLRKETYLILVPGMEGHHGVFNTLCERLKIFALCMQPGLDHPYETPRETAQRLIEKVVKLIEFKENFYLLGYSYGVLIALEMATLLEQRGLQGTIFCVDSAPDVFPVQLKAVLEDVSENDIQNAVIDHMYTVIAGKESEGLSEQLVSISSWKDKIDLYSQHLRGTTHCSSQYVRTLIDTAYGRIVEAKKYDPDHLKKSPMRSKIVLMRCRTQPEALAACPSDFGLSQYTRQPVDVHELQAEHSDALLDLRCTPIVHKYLDPRLLEDYSQKNLCETYSPFNNTFLNVADYTSED